MAQTEVQKQAQKRYREKNKEKTKIDNYRRSARLFVTTYADADDIKHFRSLLDAREKNLKK